MAQLEMEMRAGAPTRAAGDADALPAHEALARADEGLREMGVQRRVAVAQINEDQVAIAFVAGEIARLHHPAGGRRRTVSDRRIPMSRPGCQR